jgi:hypothetical protein
VVESTLFDGFDRIRIVNLESRADRRREMERQLARVGLSGDPRVEFFKAIRTANPARFDAPGRTVPTSATSTCCNRRAKPANPF